MRFSKKLCKIYGDQITENLFLSVLDPTSRGINFTWKIFKDRLLPGYLETQLWMTIGNNKNWKKYLPILLNHGNDKCIELYKRNNIEE